MTWTCSGPRRHGPRRGSLEYDFLLVFDVAALVQRVTEHLATERHAATDEDAPQLAELGRREIGRDPEESLNSTEAVSS